jgi:rSAM/selenodomain-associated transferase 1
VSAPLRVILFARPLVRGTVKTRLEPALGAEGALQLYEALLRYVVSVCQEAKVGPLTLAYAGEHPGTALATLGEGLGARLVSQGPGDLGDRMARALGDALQAGAWPVLLGTDLAGLKSSHLTAAAAALRAGDDYAFAPAEDGGYGVVAARRLDPELFSAMPWSTPSVMKETAGRLAELGRVWTRLPSLYDIDGPEDLPRLEDHPVLGPALAALGHVSPS